MEFDARMKNWVKNHAIVVQMNKEHDEVQFADNFTSDLSDAEYEQMLGALAVPEHGNKDGFRRLSSDDSRQLQSRPINWVTQGKVHPVKD